MTTKGGWLDPELCAKARREEVEHIRRHKMYVRVPREVCSRETGRAPIKTRWAETDKGQPGKLDVRARWVAKEYEPPLKALKIVLSEIATGKRGRKVVALIDVRRACFYAPARRRVFVELPLEDYQPGDEHMRGLLQCSLYNTRTTTHNWEEEEVASTLTYLMLTRGIACPCVWQGMHQGKTHRGNRSRRRLLLLLSDPDGSGCLAPLSSAPSPSTATSSSLCSSLLAPATSLVPVPRSARVMALGRTPDADDLPYETRGCGVGSCCVSSAIFFWDSDSG